MGSQAVFVAATAKARGQNHPLVLIFSTNIWSLSRAWGDPYWLPTALTSFQSLDAGCPLTGVSHSADREVRPLQTHPPQKFSAVIPRNLIHNVRSRVSHGCIPAHCVFNPTLPWLKWCVWVEQMPHTLQTLTVNVGPIERQFITHCALRIRFVFACECVV